MDSKRTLTQISDNVQALIGCTPKSLLHNRELSFMELIHPEDRDNLQSAIYTCSSSPSKKYQAEYRMKTMWGAEKWIHEEGTCILDKKGNIVAVEGIISDTTLEKSSQAFLRESEKRFQVLIEHAPVGICIFFKDMITFVNPVFQKMLGVKSPQEMLGSSLLNYIAPQRRADIRELIQSDKITTFTKQGYETIGLRNDGTQIFLQIFLTKLDLGDFQATLAYFIDITDSKKRELALIESEQKAHIALEANQRMEKALKDSEEKYRTITESISDYLYKVVIDEKDTSFIFSNAGCEKILGYTSSEFTSNPSLFYDILMPEDKVSVMSSLYLVKDQKSNKTIEHRVLHKNGKIIWISNTFIFYKETKRTFEVNGVIKDITFRKHFEHALQEAEQRYRSVFDQSGLASNVYDLTGKLIMQTTLAAKMIGGSAHDFLGKTIEEIFNPETAASTRAIFNETLNARQVVIERLVTLNTGTYWLKSWSHPIKDDAGKIIGIQIMSQDITEKKELDRKILNTIVETEEKERVKFAQELHDGLGPIISAIKMYVQWLSRADSKVSHAEILSDTDNLIKEAIQAIREISFKLSPHILNNFGLMEALTSFAKKIQLTQNINIHISGNLTDRLAETTEVVLYRILCECINNTIKHAQASTIVIKIDKQEKYLKVTYIDNGIGFDLDAAMHNKTGNGLFNMQSRLQSINAALDIQSKPGNGTRIYIDITL